MNDAPPTTPRADPVRPLMRSGGANGSDSEWAECAAREGFPVHQIVFEGHPAAGRTNHKVATRAELDAVRPVLARVARRVNKKVPRPGSYAYDLLARNALVVAGAHAVYAVGTRSTPATPGALGVDGGTGWACELYVEQCEHPNLFLFDQSAHVNAWFVWLDGLWMRCKAPMWPGAIPVRSTWVGIGSRDVTAQGRQAIVACVRRPERPTPGTPNE